jgi:hypothetical protein
MVPARLRPWRIRALFATGHRAWLCDDAPGRRLYRDGATRNFLKTDTMANTVFHWAWNDYPPQSDPGMTRTRAARLLRAWRATSRKPRASGFVMRTLERIGPGRYRVTDNASGERGTLIVLRQ